MMTPINKVLIDAGGTTNIRIDERLAGIKRMSRGVTIQKRKISGGSFQPRLRPFVPFSAYKIWGSPCWCRGRPDGGSLGSAGIVSRDGRTVLQVRSSSLVGGDKSR